ncbi:methyltransferase family protein [Nocardia inohanensis]|uniref:methyltransferase family protein n=1 Tax=Nocardia inohanensis TaxID=209246 RepID=UPI00083659E6|nr:isoprenylcysteine carboxylmethyltransferase family protein [Nocardia inohanensis]
MTRDSLAERGARVVFIPPPLYYAAALAGGALLDQVIALPVGGRPATAIIGGVAAALGLAFTFSGVAAVIRHRTTIVPHRPVAHLITTGVYRLSRNPMYTGLAVAVTGCALLMGTWWPILLLPVTLVLITFLVIRPEERYLTARFDREYLDYRTAVRRWI